MSLILDALRKLDRQKSLNRKGTEDLASTILKVESSPSGKKWRLPLAAVSLTAAATAVITYLAVMGFGPGGKSSPIPSVNLPASAEKAPRTIRAPEAPQRMSPPAPEKSSLASSQLTHAAPEPSHSAKSSPSSTPVSQASPPQPEAASSTGTVPPKTLTGEAILSPSASQNVAIPPLKPGSPVESKPLASEPPSAKGPTSTADSSPREPVRDVQSGKTQEPPRKETQPGNKAPASTTNEKIVERKATPEKVERSAGPAKKPAETAVNGPSPSPPRMKISGIVWHDDPDKRRAVINGVFTSEGSVIDGLKVVEILPTRVRFLHQGRPLEISVFE